MKRIIIFTIILAKPLVGMDPSKFDTLKHNIENSTNKCSQISNYETRFKTWKQEYQKLWNLLPNNSQQLDSLLNQATDQNYTNPIFLFLIHYKKQNLPQSTFSLNNWLPFLNTNAEPTDVELKTINSDNKNLIDFVQQTAQDYELVLPYTKFTKQVWQHEKLPLKPTTVEFKSIGLTEFIECSSMPSENLNLLGIDLWYLYLLPGNEKLSGLSIKKKLTDMPKNLDKLLNITTLLLKDNSLQKLPVMPKNLTILSLSRNNFDELPADIGNLATLETLAAYRNKLTKDPSELLKKLKKLKKLDLSNNQLTQIKGLPEWLEVAILHNNQLVQVPCLPENAQLKTIELHENKIKQFSYNILCGLKHLQTFTDNDRNIIRIQKKTN